MKPGSRDQSSYLSQAVAHERYEGRNEQDICHANEDEHERRAEDGGYLADSSLVWRRRITDDASSSPLPRCPAACVSSCSL